jgi:hypothetical protein
MAYDSTRNRVMMFGGVDALRNRELWEWDGTTWLQKPIAGNWPSSRAQCGIAYDAQRAQLLLYGGTDDSSFRSELWVWNGTSWSEKSPTVGIKPGVRAQMPMAYDSARDRVVLFGGLEAATRKDEVWEFDGARWEDRTPNGDKPSSRIRHAMAYDSARKRVVLFGGMTGSTRLQDVWEWNGNVWLDRTPAVVTATNLPPARQSAAMAYDRARGKTVLFGGADATSSRQDVWEWDGATWAEVAPAGNIMPSARSGHTMVFDTVRNRVVMFGGAGATYPTDTWEWDGTAWVDKTPPDLGGPYPSSPTARNYAAMAFDEVRGRAVLFGGNNGGLQPNVWEWDGSTWEMKVGVGAGPPVRQGHAMAYDRGRGKVVLFGGLDSARYGDFYEWDGLSWTDQTKAPAGLRPSPRYWHSMAYDDARGEILVFGGSEPTQKQDLWAWSGGPARQPAIQLFVDAAQGYFNLQTITGMRVRAHCGGDFSPYATANTGATLYAWSAGGPGLPSGSWRPLKSSTAGVNALAPWLPAPAVSSMDWTATSKGEALQLYLARNKLLAFQCRPSGVSGVGPREARVGLDYLELRVRYSLP